MDCERLSLVKLLFSSFFLYHLVMNKDYHKVEQDKKKLSGKTGGVLLPPPRRMFYAAFVCLSVCLSVRLKVVGEF